MPRIIAGILIAIVGLSAVMVTHAQAPQAPQPPQKASVLGDIATGAALSQIPIVGPLAPLYKSLPQEWKNKISGYGGQQVSWISLRVIGWIVFVINYIIGIIGATLFSIAGLLVELGLFLNATILNQYFVQLGWRLVRDFANLGFVIGIVVIAYGTILQIDSYYFKKTLLYFIIAAVMVNFSFAIAGFFIDASNLVTNFFVTEAIGGPAETLPFSGTVSGTGKSSSAHQLALALADAIGPQKLLIAQDKNLDSFTAISGVGAIIGAVASIFFVTLFTIFAALGMLAVGITTFYRFIMLSGLVIVMPAAILCSPFPSIKQHWNKWLSEFTCHLLYLPVATFFIYLVIVFVRVKSAVPVSEGFNTLIQSAAKNAGNAPAVNEALGLMANVSATIGEMIVVLGLLFMGIVQARKLGCAGGNIAINGITDLGKWAMGRPGAVAGAIARKTLTVGSQKEGVGATLGNLLSKVPLARRLVPGLNQFIGGAQAKIAKYKGDYDALNNQQLLGLARSAELRLNPEKMAAVGQLIAQKGLFRTDNETDTSKGLTKNEFDRFINPIKRFGMAKDVFESAPHLYRELGMKESDVLKIKDKKIKEHADELGLLAPDKLLSAARDPKHKMNVSPFHLAAAGRVIAEKGLFRREGDPNLSKGFTSKEFSNRFGATVKQWGVDKDILKIMPSIYKEFNPNATNEQFTGFMAETFKRGKDIDDVNPLAFEDQRVIANLNSAHVEQLGRNGTPEQRAAFIKTFANMYTASGVVEKAEFDDFAEIITKTTKRGTPLWSDVSQKTDTKAYFDGVKDMHRQRTQQPPQQQPPSPAGGPPQPPPSAGGPPQPPQGPAGGGPQPPAGGPPAGGPATPPTSPTPPSQPPAPPPSPPQPSPQPVIPPLPTTPPTQPTTPQQPPIPTTSSAVEQYRQTFRAPRMADQMINDLRETIQTAAPSRTYTMYAGGGDTAQNQQRFAAAQELARERGFEINTPVYDQAQQVYTASIHPIEKPPSQGQTAGGTPSEGTGGAARIVYKTGQPLKEYQNLPGVGTPGAKPLPPQPQPLPTASPPVPATPLPQPTPAPQPLQQPPQTPPPLSQPPKKPASENNQRLARVIWDINARRRDWYQNLPNQKEERLTILKSTRDALDASEKEYLKITGNEPPGGALPYPPGLTTPLPPIMPTIPTPQRVPPFNAASPYPTTPTRPITNQSEAEAIRTDRPPATATARQRLAQKGRTPNFPNYGGSPSGLPPQQPPQKP